MFQLHLSLGLLGIHLAFLYLSFPICKNGDINTHLLGRMVPDLNGVSILISILCNYKKEREVVLFFSIAFDNNFVHYFHWFTRWRQKKLLLKHHQK